MAKKLDPQEIEQSRRKKTRADNREERKAVSYTHLDVYKRQVVYGLAYQRTPFTLQRTPFCRLLSMAAKKFFKKYAPLLLRKRERVVSADMRFERVASRCV